jgi:hypothetical protein
MTSVLQSKIFRAGLGRHQGDLREDARRRTTSRRASRRGGDGRGQGEGREILIIKIGMKPQVDKLENRFIFRMNTKEGE